MQKAAWRLAIVLSVVLGGQLLVTEAAAKGRNFEGRTNEKTVKSQCGSDLQSGGGAFGCTKCDKEGCTDWSCNNSGKGRQGCWVTPVGKTVPGGGQGGTGAPVTGGMKGDRQGGTPPQGNTVGQPRDDRNQMSGKVDTTPNRKKAGNAAIAAPNASKSPAQRR